MDGAAVAAAYLPSASHQGQDWRPFWYICALLFGKFTSEFS